MTGTSSATQENTDYPKKTIGENVEARGSIGNVQGTGRG